MIEINSLDPFVVSTLENASKLLKGRSGQLAKKTRDDITLLLKLENANMIFASDSVRWALNSLMLENRVKIVARTLRIQCTKHYEDSDLKITINRDGEYATTKVGEYVLIFIKTPAQYWSLEEITTPSVMKMFR